MMKGGRPQAISVSPCCSLVMFWMPAPGMTLMLNPGSLLLMSSAKPPACEYQPPPTWPAVQVMFLPCWASPGSVAASASTRVSARIEKRRMVISSLDDGTGDIVLVDVRDVLHGLQSDLLGHHRLD